ncbi:helix-turn-helix domain-containing protein, partial [Kitasatospora sp. NPDC059571]|uniref:helix-turn-helix domain-containing protein n=1 Tax=Kitasatospora sp. NPDC059571 TaxID=3346871 RepID=UPI00369453D9
MARKPRPIDPTDGPIPAFAFDLRKVREQAGEPTYRALATLAGFSATTLSDAAGGVRLPSLEVTLAYVGACGGDVTAWELRWRELDRELSAPAAAADPDRDPDASLAAAPDAAAPGAQAGRGALATAAPPAAVPDVTAPAPDTVSSGPARSLLPPWARWWAGGPAGSRGPGGGGGGRRAPRPPTTGGPPTGGGRGLPR